MTNNIPFFPFRNNSESKPNPKQEYPEVKPPKELIQQIMAYSRALDVIRLKDATVFCIMN